MFHKNNVSLNAVLSMACWGPTCLALLFIPGLNPGSYAIGKCMCAKPLQSRPTLYDSRTVAHQAPLSMGFSKQEFWGGLPCSPRGDLPNPGAKPWSPASPAVAGGFFTPRACYRKISDRKV